jgi:hypothetical protein
MHAELKKDCIRIYREAKLKDTLLKIKLICPICHESAMIDKSTIIYDADYILTLMKKEKLEQ